MENQESGIKNQGSADPGRTSSSGVHRANGSRSAYIPLLVLIGIATAAIVFFAMPLVECGHVFHDVTISGIGEGEWMCSHCGGRARTTLFRRLFPSEEFWEFIVVGDEVISYGE